MDKFVARQNIQHYREKLATEMDEATIVAPPARRRRGQTGCVGENCAEEEAKLLEFSLPFPPVCRLKADELFLVFRLDPATEDASARKYQRMWPSTGIEDSQFQLAVEWRGRYQMPFHAMKCRTRPDPTL